MSILIFAPDVGTVVEVDDATQHSDMGGLTKGKRRYRVNSWLKAAPEPRFDLDTPEGMEAWLDAAIENDSDLTEVVASRAMRFPRFGNVRLMTCVRAEAEYVSCSGVAGAILPVHEVKVVGRVPWKEKDIEQLRSSALRGLGRLVG